MKGDRENEFWVLFDVPEPVSINRVMEQLEAGLPDGVEIHHIDTGILVVGVGEDYEMNHLSRITLDGIVTQLDGGVDVGISPALKEEKYP